MTYYEQLVENAEAAMERHPRSTIVMDAESFDIISSGVNADKVCKEADKAVTRGRTPVVIQKPHNPDTWVL